MSQVPQHAGLGQIDGIHGDAEFRSHFLGGTPLNNKFPTGLRRGWFEVGLYQRERAADEVCAIFGFVQLQPRIRIGNRIGIERAVCTRRSRAAFSCQISPGVQHYRFQPGAKAAIRIVAKLRQLLIHGDKHRLHEIGRVGIGQAKSPAPREEQRCIQLDEPTPGVLIRAARESFEECQRCRVH